MLFLLTQLLWVLQVVWGPCCPRKSRNPHDPGRLHPAAPSIPDLPGLSQRAAPASSSAAPCLPKMFSQAPAQRRGPKAAAANTFQRFSRMQLPVQALPVLSGTLLLFSLPLSFLRAPHAPKNGQWAESWMDQRENPIKASCGR